MKTLLVVWHSMTGGTRAMAEAAARGAAAETGTATRLLRAAEAGPEDVLAADGYLFATPENLAKGKALQVFDAKTFEPIRNVPTGDRCWHFTFTPDDSHILVACGRSNEVVVIDAKTLEPVKRIADKKMPWGIVTYPKAIGSLDVP